MKRMTVIMPETLDEIYAMQQSFWAWRANSKQNGTPIAGFIDWLRKSGSAHDADIRIEIGNHGDPSVGINGEGWTLTVDTCQAGEEMQIAKSLLEIFDDFCEFPAEYLYIDGEDVIRAIKFNAKKSEALAKMHGQHM